jgi:hypothetical protein
VSVKAKEEAAYYCLPHLSVLILVLEACPLFIEGNEVREPLTLVPFAPLFPKSRKSVCWPQYPKLMKK